MAPSRTLIPFAAAISLGACDGGGERPAEASVLFDTIDGVEHVVSGATGAWGTDGGWSLDTASAVTIGRLEGDEAYTFGEVSDVLVAADGTIYVADTQALEVRAFSAEGEFLFDLGGSGEGPGEFGNISGLAWAPEGLAVLDASLFRVSVFRPDGELVRTFRIERPYRLYGHDWAMAFDSAGRYHDLTVLRQPEGPDSLGVVRYAAGGQVLDSVALLAQERDLLLIMRGERPIMGLVRPFAPRPAVDLAPDGRAFVAQGGTYRVDVVSVGGEPVRVIRREVGGSPVTAAEADSARRHIVEQAREAGGDPPDEIRVPERKPVIAEIEVDDLGNLWIQPPPEPGARVQRWWVHDRVGRYLGTVAVPRMRVTHIGDGFVAGTTTDELGVQRALVAPLRRR